jgi:predicted aconitase with swiveling domain
MTLAKTFQGRVILSGELKGECVVSHGGVNILASFQKSVLQNAKKVICADQNNADIYNKNLTGVILCLPQTIGSTTGGMVLQTVAQMGIAPAAMLFSQHIDSLACAGVILAEVWQGKRIVTVDQLGEEFLNYVQDGMAVGIDAEGYVTFG